MDGKSVLGKLRTNNVGHLVIGYININSIRNKFQGLVEIVNGNIDILMIAETKLDFFFPNEQFSIHGYCKHVWVDRNSNGCGPLVYVRDDIPLFQLKSFSFIDDIECICFEINLHKRNDPFCIYRPPTQEQSYLFDVLSKAIDHYREKNENFKFVRELMQLKRNKR